jgi:O-glycosyl hydrolase
VRLRIGTVRRLALTIVAISVTAAAACSTSPPGGARGAAGPLPPSVPAADCPGGRRNDPVTVRVDARRQFQTIQGFGTSVRLFDDPHVTNTFDPDTGHGAVVVPPDDQQAILQHLYGELHLTRLRPITDAGVQPAPADSHGGAPVRNFDGKRTDGFVGFARQAYALGATTVFPAPLVLEPWMKGHDATEYVDWALAIIRRWRDRGLPLAYWSVANEPGGSLGLSAEYVRDVVKLLGPRLRAEGIDTRFVVPDDINPAEALKRLQVVLADPAARPYLGAVAYHLYGHRDAQAQIQQLAARQGLPVWMTEFFTKDALAWADTVHDLLVDQGVAAVDYLWGFFGAWKTDGDQLITIDDDGGRYTGWRFSRQYFTFGQWTRFVPPGSRRVAAGVSGSGLRVSAFAVPDGLAVVAVNDGRRCHPTRIEVSGAGIGPGATATRTSDSESWAQLPAPTVEAGVLVATLAPRSVTTYVLPIGGG